MHTFCPIDRTARDGQCVHNQESLRSRDNRQAAILMQPPFATLGLSTMLPVTVLLLNAAILQRATHVGFVMHHVLTATLRGLRIHFVHNASAPTLLTVVRAGAFALDVPPGMLSFDRFSRRSPAPNSIHAQTLTMPSQVARGSPLLYSRGCWHRH